MLATVEGSIYVALTESVPPYKVEIELFSNDSLGGLSRRGKVPGKILSDLSGLAYGNTPYWFGLNGDHMRYDIQVFPDGSCEISWDWDKI
jgi:hypothetical protein